MPKILFLYYSRTGNTQKMAEAVAEGARSIQGVDVELEYYATPEACFIEERKSVIEG